jgi:hypothetical protein
MQTMTHSIPSITQRAQVVFVAVFALMWTACDSTSPSPGDEASMPLTLSFVTTPAGNAAGTSAKAAKSRSYTDGRNALTVETAEIVLSEIEFERADAAEACRTNDDEGERDDDNCEELEEGPVLVALPLDSDQPAVVIESVLPEGRWEEAEFEIEALDDEDDAAFLDETGFPEDVSIRVTGTWTPAGGEPQSFTYLSDLEGEQEIEFEPPIEATADSPKNVTFRVDMDRWFRQSDGTLVNPDEGNEDGRYEDLIEDNIENSIEGFEDDDRDGDEDEDDDSN